jgi:hypothetical protein
LPATQHSSASNDALAVVQPYHGVSATEEECTETQRVVDRDRASSLLTSIHDPSFRIARHQCLESTLNRFEREPITVLTPKRHDRHVIRDDWEPENRGQLTSEGRLTRTGIAQEHDAAPELLRPSTDKLPRQSAATLTQVTGISDY